MVCSTYNIRYIDTKEGMLGYEERLCEYRTSLRFPLEV